MTAPLTLQALDALIATLKNGGHYFGTVPDGACIAAAEELREARRVLVEEHEAYYTPLPEGQTSEERFYRRQVARETRLKLAARIAREEAPARGEKV